MNQQNSRIIALLMMCFVISLAPVVLGNTFQQTDVNMLKAINLQRERCLDTFFIMVTNSVTYVCIGTLVALISVKSWRRHLPYFITAFLVAVIISTALKFGIHRARPFLTYSFIEKLSGGGSPSFPSGHTTDAFLIAVAVSMVSCNRVVIFICFAWAVLVAYSRMCLGVHYPSDVLAGIATGSVAAILCYRERLWQPVQLR